MQTVRVELYFASNACLRRVRVAGHAFVEHGFSPVCGLLSLQLKSFASVLESVGLLAGLRLPEEGWMDLEILSADGNARFVYYQEYFLQSLRFLEKEFKREIQVISEEL